MQTLIERIDALLARRSLLQHPFYVLWSEGKLTLASLRGYAKEYHQLVKAVPQFVASVSAVAPARLQAGLAANQAEEQEHVALWESFAQGIGLAEVELLDYAGLAKTQAAVEQLRTLSRSFTGGAAAMYAFEKPLPVISETKLKGLQSFYGIKAPATMEYFRVHAVVDIEHAAHWQRLLEAEAASQADGLYADAEQAVAAQHLLLDSCMEAYC